MQVTQLRNLKTFTDVMDVTWEILNGEYDKMGTDKEEDISGIRSSIQAYLGHNQKLINFAGMKVWAFENDTNDVLYIVHTDYTIADKPELNIGGLCFEIETGMFDENIIVSRYFGDHSISPAEFGSLFVNLANSIISDLVPYDIDEDIITAAAIAYVINKMMNVGINGRKILSSSVSTESVTTQMIKLFGLEFFDHYPTIFIEHDRNGELYASYENGALQDIEFIINDAIKMDITNPYALAGSFSRYLRFTASDI